MGEFNRKSDDFVARWDRFQICEGGFYPPKLAALFLKITPQGAHSASMRGVLRYQIIGCTRFYSRSSVLLQIEKNVRKLVSESISPLDRHIGSTARLVISDSFLPCPEVTLWNDFAADHGGIYPARVAAMRLRITTQGVLLAHRAGWIRSFCIGRENFYSQNDVSNYWFEAARSNRNNRAKPRFSGREVSVRI
jgi:hypothetical protein